jgi:hypothetical protein
VTKSIISLSFPIKQNNTRVALHLKGRKLSTSWDLMVNLPIYYTSSNVRIKKRL